MQLQGNSLNSVKQQHGGHVNPTLYVDFDFMSKTNDLCIVRLFVELKVCPSLE